MTSCVAIVDDDRAIRESLETLLQMHGFECRMFKSGEDFLARHQDDFDCVLLDIRMPGRDGLEVLEDYIAGGRSRPVIMMSGHADLPMAVQAMRQGALNFFEKPFDQGQLLTSIAEAMRVAKDMSIAREGQADINARLASLTPRQRDIGNLICSGLLNKQIAHELNISIRTVETHRSHLMTKMGVRTLAALVSVWPVSG